ncbi:MAG: potassium-transporting ATPase subunit KdpC [Proteobacteria bacterium]|nr:potassium-transporting ATPase subunit KdpC [Pseudomonadota bacterium]
MKTLRTLIVSLVFFTLLFGGIYPAVSTVLLKALFKDKTEASLIVGKDGKVLGSELIGQSFSEPEYFWGRLSGTGPNPYNASASTGTNYSNGNEKLIQAAKDRIAALKAADASSQSAIPADLVTASASGLDPHISIAAAQYQIPRVAKARSKSEAEIRSLVERYTEGRQFGLFGEPRVNVLKLNLTLDGKL